MGRKGCCASRPRCRKCPLRGKRNKALELADDEHDCRQIVALVPERSTQR